MAAVAVLPAGSEAAALAALDRALTPAALQSLLVSAWDELRSFSVQVPSLHPPFAAVPLSLPYSGCAT